MKMGTIRSPWRYDGVRWIAPTLAAPRRSRRIRYAI
jgi:hypothetical protein